MTDIEGLRLRITGTSTGLSQAIDGARAKITSAVAGIKERLTAFRTAALATEQSTQQLSFSGLAAKLSGLAATAAKGLKIPITGDTTGLSQAISAARSSVASFLGRQSSIALPAVSLPATTVADPFSAFRKSSAQATQQVQSFANSVRQTNSDLQGVTFGGLAAKLAAVVGVASLARSAINFASSAEQTAVSLRVLLGSAEKAASMIRELRALAASTPLEVSGLTENARLMLNFGVAANQVLPNLRMLGDITGGNAEKMHLMSLAFSQSSAAGRLMGQDLLQMINSGFNPLLEISERTGVSMVDLKKRMEDGNISFAAVRAAFQSATAEGGRFAGMMEEQSKTFAGAMGKLRDAWQLFLAKIGNEAIPHLSNLAANLTNLINATGGLSGENVILAAKVGAFLLVFQKVITIVPKIVAGFQAIAKAQAVALALSGPAGWATLAIGIAAAAGAVYTLDRAFAAQGETVTKATSEIVTRKKAQEDLNRAMADTAKKTVELTQLSSESVAATKAQAEEVKKRFEDARESADKAKKIADDQRKLNAGFAFDDAPENVAKRDNQNQRLSIWADEQKQAADKLREQLGSLNEALDRNASHWEKQAEATRKAFQFPIDKLKEQLAELAEQVKQGSLELDVFDRAAAASISDYKSKIEQAQPRDQQIQFAGIVAGSQADVQTVFQFQNQFSQLGANDKQDETNELLRQIRQELINNGRTDSQPPPPAN